MEIKYINNMNIKIKQVNLQLIHAKLNDRGYTELISDNNSDFDKKFLSFLSSSSNLDNYNKCSQGKKLKLLLNADYSKEPDKFVKLLQKIKTVLKSNHHISDDESIKNLNEVINIIDSIIGPPKILLKDNVKNTLNEVSYTGVSDNFDETILAMANSIESKLKKNGKYILLNDYIKNIPNNIFNDEKIKEYRKYLHLWRHHSDDNYTKRRNISDNEKKFIINYGSAILEFILNVLEDE